MPEPLNNPLYPAYTVIEYHSADGFHTMTIPNNEPDDVTGDPNELTLVAWNATSRNWLDMVTDLLAECVPRLPATGGFDRATLWTLDTPTSLPTFRGSASVTTVGTAATPGWSRATQETINLRDSNGKVMKLTLLDFASGNDFGKYVNPGTIGVDGIVAELVSDTNAWASRQNARPVTFLSRTATLNEKLRRSYRLG